MDLDSIDTSAWKVKDKGWKSERAEKWLELEKVLSENRRKSELNVIKQYYLRGKMPNWEKYKNWDNLGRGRHVDLFLFLWLHPSSDLDCLTGLCRDYINCGCIHHNDLNGFDAFLYSEFNCAVDPDSGSKLYKFDLADGKNIVVFRAWINNFELFSDRLDYMVESARGGRSAKGLAVLIRCKKYFSFINFKRWLLCDSEVKLTRSCLFRYHDVIEWVFTGLHSGAESGLLDSIKYNEGLVSYQKALLCIFNYDASVEDGTGRARSVLQLRKLLDEYPYATEFKKIWEDVKSGRIEAGDAFSI